MSAPYPFAIGEACTTYIVLPPPAATSLAASRAAVPFLNHSFFNILILISYSLHV